jgi:hemolysin III
MRTVLRAGRLTYSGRMSPRSVRKSGTSAARHPGSALDGLPAEEVGNDPQLPDLPLLHASEPAATEVKPTWRGWIHAGTFPVSIAAGIVLICVAHGAPARWACAVFMVTSMLLFGNSALYHRFDWKPRTKVILKRIDHANIFLLIAGTYTPLAVLALPSSKGILLLSLVWGTTIVGICFRVLWIGAPRWLYVALYIATGWAAMMYIVDLFTASAVMMALVIIGGLLYTVGAVIYGMKRPNPFPGRFGFHEIFHTLTVLAFLCHWTAVLLIALAPAYNA